MSRTTHQRWVECDDSYTLPFHPSWWFLSILKNLYEIFGILRKTKRFFWETRNLLYKFLSLPKILKEFFSMLRIFQPSYKERKQSLPPVRDWMENSDILRIRSNSNTILMTKKLTNREVLDLLHHRRNEGKIRRTANFFERVIFRNSFSEINVEGLDNIVNELIEGKRFVFIPNHQSEGDWGMLQTLLTKVFAKKKDYHASSNGLGVFNIENYPNITGKLNEYYFSNGKLASPQTIKNAIQAGDNLYVGPMDSLLRNCAAYMSIRDKKVFYSRNWLPDALLKELSKIFHIEPLAVVTRERYSIHNIEQINRIRGEEDSNITIFPEFEEESGKFGRSYWGGTNKFYQLVFKIVKRGIKRSKPKRKSLSEDTIRLKSKIEDTLYATVAFSYEAVAEAEIFPKLKTMKSKFVKNAYDLLHTFAATPFMRRIKGQRSRVYLKFGKSLPVENGMGDQETADYLRKKVIESLVVFPLQAILYSMDNYNTSPKDELEHKVRDTIEKLKSQSSDISPFYTANGNITPFNSMLRRARRLGFITYDKDTVYTINPEVAKYYRNKVDSILSTLSQKAM